MMKRILAASALAIFVTAPALAVYDESAMTGTPGSHVRISDAQGGYTSDGTYIRPHDRLGSNGPFWRVNPVTGPVLLAAAPITSGYDSYAYAPAAGVPTAASPVVIDGNKVLGADPDPSVRLEMRRGSVELE